MSAAELAKYMDEQKKLGGQKKHTQEEIADILGIGVTTLKDKTRPFRTKEEKPKNMTQKKNIFTEEEIKVLKEIVKEYENNFFKSNEMQPSEYEIYKELEKVRTDAETIRSAFNMSKETTERLKHFSQVRRIPLQDLVELAVITLLDKYDK